MRRGMLPWLAMMPRLILGCSAMGPKESPLCFTLHADV